MVVACVATTALRKADHAVVRYLRVSTRQRPTVHRQARRALQTADSILVAAHATTTRQVAARVATTSVATTTASRHHRRQAVAHTASRRAVVAIALQCRRAAAVVVALEEQPLHVDKDINKISYEKDL